MEKYDFAGYATKNNVRCTDGRVIRKGAFSDQNGGQVPLVWSHNHNSVENVLGHAILKEDENGMYAYGYFNNTKNAEIARVCLAHGDFDALSIYANQLQENGNNVIHGNIKEVSLCLAGANPGALIDTIIAHSEDSEEEAVMLIGGNSVELYHADKQTDDNPLDADPKTEIEEVINSLTPEQRSVVEGLIGMALETNMGDEPNNEPIEGGKEMKQNVFDNDLRDDNQEHVLTHSQMEVIFKDAKREGSLKESVLKHADEYGIKDIDWLFPEANNLNVPPTFINNPVEWVATVMNGVHRYPFAKIKSMFADIRSDDARAKGYMKGKYKKEEVFSLLKRETTPTTIYKKQKLDRDDVADIIEFDVVAWLKAEMRQKLDEEIARCILIGDGRSSLDEDKVSETNIRPIWTDEDLFTVKKLVSSDAGATAFQKAEDLIDTVIRAHDDYRGSGNPTLFIAQDALTDMLLIKDTTGRRIYNSVSDLSTTLMVSKIVPVALMKGQKRTVGSDTHELLALMVNLNDYYVGADKGGAVSMFDDFDIDYNQQKYLIETRCSGALVVPYSAVAFERKAA